MSDTAASALISVHDVMPGTLAETRRICAELAALGVPAATLLVVPGCDWKSGDLDTLRDLAAAGHELAAHGWQHRVDRFNSLGGRLHGLLISRNAGEHLGLDRQQLRAMLRRSFAWFGAREFPSPTLYVPPAWALGSLALEDFCALPFSRIELLSGVYEVQRRQLLRLPLAGYQADRRWRTPLLRLFNAGNELLARRSGRPLRIAIHPGDLDTALGGDLRDAVARRARASYRYAALPDAAGGWPVR